MDNLSAIANLRQDFKGAWKSERLVYRAVDPEADKNVLRKINADPLTFGMGGGALFRPQGLETAKGLAELLHKSYLAVIIQLAPKEGRLDETYESPYDIGFVCLGMGGDNPIYPSIHSRSQTLGISLFPQYQKKGYGSEAIRWVLDWAFHFGNLHRVELHVMEYNMGARKCYERIGFVPEGRQREVTYAGGRYWDVLQYSILDREWQALKAEASVAKAE